MKQGFIKVSDQSFMNAKIAIQQIKAATVATLTIFVLFAAIIASPLLLLAGVEAHAQRASSGLAGTTFPPPVFYTITSQPSYEISIPFSSIGKPSFEPQEISIPAGMTVIWFNDDSAPHSITTLTNSTYSAPESIVSGPVPQDGGSFIHTFNHAGRYVYFDEFNPSMQGIINVGPVIEIGKSFNMHIGGINTIPFNPNKLERVVLSFVPKTVSFPPIISITYNVTLLNSTGKALYSHTYEDSDGILDLELIPAHKLPLSSTSTSNNVIATSPNNVTRTATIAKQFSTYGPDFIVQEAIHTDGVFHIRGPVLIENSPYSIQISIVGKDNKIFPSPISETFELPHR